MFLKAAVVTVLIATHATSSVQAILDQLEKYEIHKLSDHSHLNNARNGRKLIQSRGERKLSYEFEAFGRVLALELTRDDELFAPDYKHYFAVPNDDGSHEYIVDENVDTKCHYKAIIKDDPHSMGRVSLCGPGMRAMFRHSEIGQFHIEPLDDKGDEHAVYRALDMKKSDKRGCGVNDSHILHGPKGKHHGHATSHQEHQDSVDYIPPDLSKEIITVTQYEHDNKSQGHQRRVLVNLPDKLIRMLVVNDNTRYKQMGGAVHTNAAQIIASVDTLYSTIGGSYTFDLQIVGMITFSVKDPFTVPIEASGYPTADNILTLFTNWAAANSNSANFPVQYSDAVMFSGYNFEGSTIGLAWVGEVCHPSYKMNIVQTVDLIDGVIAIAAAHELGHNLGMRHDDVSDVNSLIPTPCYDSSVPHIMDSSVSSNGVASFSTCSANWVKMQFEGYGTYAKRYDVTNYPACMEKCYIGDSNPPVGCVGVATRNESIPVCGDGLREGSEECDCPNKDCTNVDPCCDGATCTLKSTSQCSIVDPCCTSTCQIVPANSQVCRAATGECDIAESCDGVSATCPTDTFLQIGSSCTASGRAGICYNKGCKSHWAMCMKYGTTAQWDDTCSWRDDDDGDAACGNPYCHPVGAGAGSCSYYPSLIVENGTPCAANKACLNQVCTPYSSFPNQPTPSSPTSKSPTAVPTTKTPTSAVPTTKSPTSDSPTTKTPVSSPTKSPTNRYGTNRYESIKEHCQTWKLMSGASPSSCMDLLADYAIEIVKSIASSTGYYSNDLSKGLRVQASIIKCSGTENTPVVESLFTLTGDSSLIMTKLQSAGTYNGYTKGLGCPLQGLYEVVQNIENEWSSASNRPYKSLITLTDGLFSDALPTAITTTAAVNAVGAIRYRCTPSLVVVLYKMTKTSDPIDLQQTSLKILTGNIATSVFEAMNVPWIVIPKIGEQITSLLISSNARCSSSSSFSTIDRYWCGYNHPTTCTARTSCEWLLTPSKSCSKISSQSGCNFTIQSTCIANTSCQWNTSTSKCTRKPEEPDCNAYFTSTLCATKPNFCNWNGSACIVNTIG